MNDAGKKKMMSTIAEKGMELSLLKPKDTPIYMPCRDRQKYGQIDQFIEPLGKHFAFYNLLTHIIQITLTVWLFVTDVFDDRKKTHPDWSTKIKVTQ